MTDFDGETYDAVYDQFKVDQITQLLQIWSPSNHMNMIDGDIYVLYLRPPNPSQSMMNVKMKWLWLKIRSTQNYDFVKPKM